MIGYYNYMVFLSLASIGSTIIVYIILFNLYIKKDYSLYRRKVANWTYGTAYIITLVFMCTTCDVSDNLVPLSNLVTYNFIFTYLCSVALTTVGLYWIIKSYT